MYYLALSIFFWSKLVLTIDNLAKKLMIVFNTLSSFVVGVSFTIILATDTTPPINANKSSQWF